MQLKIISLTIVDLVDLDDRQKGVEDQLWEVHT